MIISFLGIHKYQTHPGIWHQYSYAKQTTKVWKTCSKLNFWKGFCEFEQKKDVNSTFLGTFFYIFTALSLILSQISGFMDFLSENFVICCCFKCFCSKFKNNIYQTDKLLKSWKVSKFIISCLGIQEYPCHPEFWIQY